MNTACSAALSAPRALPGTGLGPGSDENLTAAAIDARIEFEQSLALFEGASKRILIGLGFALLPVLLFWGRLPQPVLLGWLGLRVLMAALRCADILHFQRSQAARSGDASHLRARRQRFLLLLAADAFSWGLLGWLFHVPQQPELDGFVLAYLIALSSTGLFVLGGRFHANVLFCGIALLPLTAYQLSLGSQGGLLTGLGLLGFLGIAVLEARRLEQRHAELLRLRHAHDWAARQSEQALQSAEHSSSSKSRFVAVMSHEIRTPLNGILGMTQLLERSTLDAQQREQLDIVGRSGRHLLALVNDILDLARIESGKLAVDAGPVHVRELVEEVCRLLEPTARAKGLDFELSVAPELPQRALGDGPRIKQVLHNLIGNAIKFTERGAVAVELRELHDTRTAPELCFAVRDSGEGIAADQLERVFAPFEQARELARARRDEGSGLGLTISRELARAMGGELRCSSEPGRGSLFEFTLPLHACADIEEQHPAPITAPSPPRLHGQVLLVDDSPVNLLVARSMLELCGLQVDQAENGREALQCLEKNRYELVLMDCQMPDMDGFEATQRWRRTEQEAGLTPTRIIALTASAVNGDRERCLQSGMDDYLVKPFEMDDLLAMVKRHLLRTPGAA